jgi:hypothetical protein
MYSVMSPPFIYSFIHPYNNRVEQNLISSHAYTYLMLPFLDIIFIIQEFRGIMLTCAKFKISVVYFTERVTLRDWMHAVFLFHWLNEVLNFEMVHSPLYSKKIVT